MLRSMFSAISGLRSHQTMMDVTGNNVANVNTSGYKSTRATFQEALTQVTRGAGAPGPAQGGTNPFQVGLGTNVAAIDQNFGQGSVQTTGRATDLSISGEGMFVVGTAEAQYYTRSGAFNFDAEGNLVTANGEFVRGYQFEDPVPADSEVEIGPDAGLTQLQVKLTRGPDEEGVPIYTDPQIASNGDIVARSPGGDLVIVGRVAVARFANYNGLERVGNSLFEWTANAGDVQEGSPGDPGGFGKLQAGTLEMSNVDLAQEFTNLIIAQRGFQANSRTITTSDELLQELVNMKR